MKISDSAKRAAIKLPPDVLMHPMPFPDRLDYAEKVIQEAINEELILIREAHGASVIAQSDAVRRMEVAEEQFRKAKDWNTLCELELNNLRSLKDDLEGYLRAVMEHIAPMLKLYEPRLPEYPVIATIRDYLAKP